MGQKWRHLSPSPVGRSKTLLGSGISPQTFSVHLPSTETVAEHWWTSSLPNRVTPRVYCSSGLVKFPHDNWSGSLKHYPDHRKQCTDFEQVSRSTVIRDSLLFPQRRKVIRDGLYRLYCDTSWAANMQLVPRKGCSYAKLEDQLFLWDYARCSVHLKDEKIAPSLEMYVHVNL